jgi:hypothetical protein
MQSDIAGTEAASAEVGGRDREFLLLLGIEPYDADAIGRPDPPDLTTTVINSLAIVQFAALLIALVWMWLHLA